jgi:hypothetical protein
MSSHDSDQRDVACDQPTQQWSHVTGHVDTVTENVASENVAAI